MLISEMGLADHVWEAYALTADCGCVACVFKDQGRKET